MKRLHKKIGVGVLVAGLVLGGLGISGGSVAHASSGGFSKNQSVEDKIKNLSSKYGFEVMELEGLAISRPEQFYNHKLPFSDYESFAENIEGLLGMSRASRRPFIKVKVENRDFVFIYYNYKK